MPTTLTHYNLQGYFYPSVRRLGCNEYLKCERCSLCANFNIHDERCITCESRKSPVTRCKCFISSRSAIYALHQKLGTRSLAFPPDANSDGTDKVLLETGGNKELQEITDTIQQQNILSPVG